MLHTFQSGDGQCEAAMTRYLLQRLTATLLTLVGLTILVFGLMVAIPGTAVDTVLGLQGEATDEVVERLRSDFGLDKPLPVQYLGWLGSAVTGDFGTSWRSGREVSTLIASRLPLTLYLAGMSMLVAVLIGVPLGVMSARRQNQLTDHFLRSAALLRGSMPNFWVGAIVLLLLSLGLGVLPPTGSLGSWHEIPYNFRLLAIPSLVLGTSAAAFLLRMTRASMLEVLRNDYITTARAKGVSENRAPWSHGLRNALIPVLTLAGIQTGYLIGGTVITENVFSLNGTGRLLVDGVAQRDQPVVMATLTVTASIFILVNLMVDVAYGVIDPRVRKR